LAAGWPDSLIKIAELSNCRTAKLPNCQKSGFSGQAAGQKKAAAEKNRLQFRRPFSGVYFQGRPIRAWFQRLEKGSGPERTFLPAALPPFFSPGPP
jgi:hypothetical protein